MTAAKKLRRAAQKRAAATAPKQKAVKEEAVIMSPHQQRTFLEAWKSAVAADKNATAAAERQEEAAAQLRRTVELIGGGEYARLVKDGSSLSIMRPLRKGEKSPGAEAAKVELPRAPKVKKRKQKVQASSEEE